MGPLVPPPWLPSLATLAALFPERSALARVGIAAASLGARAVNAAVRRAVGRVGSRRLARLVNVEGAEPLLALRAARRPVVLVAWHAGLPAALGAGLVALGLEALILRHHDREGPADPGFTHVATRAAPALALHRAVVHARGGGLVLMALDVLDALDVRAWGLARAGPFTLLGRAVEVGAAAIARLSGAALVCAAPHLRPDGLALTLSAPLPTMPDDAATMATIVAWWDAWLAAHPAALWPESARAIARFPPRG